MSGMRLREFITPLSGAAAASGSRSTEIQTSRIYRIPQQPHARQVFRDHMTSPRIHHREGEVPPAAALHRLVDPDHGERLQQARVL